MSLQPMSPGPDPGACPRCGEWRKAGMIHRCPAATPDPPREEWRVVDGDNVVCRLAGHRDFGTFRPWAEEQCRGLVERFPGESFRIERRVGDEEWETWCPPDTPMGSCVPRCGDARCEAATSPDPPDAADLVAAHLRERWPCTCRPGMDGGGVYHAADCNSRREGSQAVLAVIRLLRAATPPASPDERLREAIRAALNELGVPGEGYPAPAANAVDILTAALAAADRDSPDEPKETT